MNGKNGSALGVSGDQRVKAMMDSLQRCRRLWCGEEPGIELSLRLLVPKGGHCGWPETVLACCGSPAATSTDGSRSARHPPNATIRHAPCCAQQGQLASWH
jgi:hypothetical protein